MFNFQKSDTDEHLACSEDTVGSTNASIAEISAVYGFVDERI